ncbi:hypothetical protein [Neobacillus sp. SuZ13]|nr:hypothetical protein [Neobacillus sp. SuZ13]WHY65078.1 hypothetical protein QNH17_18395 [Neobacillus sp. SuZ13]
MVGGDKEAWDIVYPIFRDTAVENGKEFPCPLQLIEFFLLIGPKFILLL